MTNNLEFKDNTAEIDILAIVDYTLIKIFRSFKITIPCLIFTILTVSSLHLFSEDGDNTYKHKFTIKNLETPLNLPLHENEFYTTVSLNKYFMNAFEKNIIPNKNFIDIKNNMHLFAKKKYPESYIEILQSIEILTLDDVKGYEVFISTSKKNDLKPIFVSMYEDSVNKTLKGLIFELEIKRNNILELKKQLYDDLDEEIYENDKYLDLLQKYKAFISNESDIISENLFIDNILTGSTNTLFTLNRQIALIENSLMTLESNNFKFNEYILGPVEFIEAVKSRDILIYPFYVFLTLTVISVLFLSLHDYIRGINGRNEK